MSNAVDAREPADPVNFDAPKLSSGAYFYGIETSTRFFENDEIDFVEVIEQTKGSDLTLT